jgi:hypothetical protein
MKLFSWFNPLWLVQNLFTTSLNPITIGAGIGAIGSAVTGKNPFTGALMGGALGGLGSAGGLFGGATGAGSGSGLLSGLKGVETVVPSLGSGGYSALGQSAFSPIGGAATGGINFANIGSNLGGTNLPLGGQGIQIDKFNPAFNFTDDGLMFADKGLSSADQMLANKFVTEQNPFALDTRRLVTDTPLTMGERISDMMINPFSELTTSDKLGLGLKGVESLSPQQQKQVETPPVAPIRPGNPNQVAPTFNLNPSSNLQNVKPKIGAQPGNELGIPNLDTTIPLTEEELLRLQQMLQTTGFRGR